MLLNIRYVQNSAKERMWECDCVARRDTANGDQQIETMITHYLLNDSYANFIRPLNTGLDENGLSVKHLWISDAEKIITKFHIVWKTLLTKTKQQCSPLIKTVGATSDQLIDAALLYVNVKVNERDYEAKLIDYTERHQSIRVKLLKLLRHQAIPNIKLELEQLLCLAYWMVSFYSTKKKKSHKSGYNAHLHHFLSDLVVIFLLLLSQLFPMDQLQFAQCDLDGILPTIYGIVKDFPINPIFLELVLKEICTILDIPQALDNSGSPKDRVSILSIKVHEHFVHKGMTWLKWVCNFPHENVCNIISDQARYMIPQTEKLRRNFVGAKNIDSAIKKINFAKDKEISVTFAQDSKQEKYSKCTIIMSIPATRRVDVMLNFPEGQRDIDIFYHVANIGIVWSVLDDDDDLPDIKRSGWFDVPNFMDFNRKIVKDVITWAKEKKGILKDYALYSKLAQIAVYLRELIVSRCHLATIKYKGGIAATMKHKVHLDVIIHFIAFRVLVMFLLPKDTYQYGESSVAKVLPAYAYNVKIPLSPQMTNAHS